METVLLLLLHAWVQVQANLFPHCFLHRNSTGIVEKVGSLLEYRVKHYLLLLLGYGGKPKLPSAITRIWGKTKIIICCC
jgi:hypothetical protein